jgi:hypothetical protein
VELILALALVEVVEILQELGLQVLQNGVEVMKLPTIFQLIFG